MIKSIGAFLLFAFFSQGGELKTNAVLMEDPPEWVTPGRINGIVEHAQHVLEWDIRRVKVYWYKDQTAFEDVHHFGPTVLAISKKADNTVHLGPRVTSENFDGVFGHEMVHIISFQKYKESIPPWLEEGLANYVSKRATVNYAWLKSHPFPDDVKNLVHPFRGTDDTIRYHYMASQALIEMIASKCNLENLLRMSVKRKMENYFETMCGIKDLNSDFKIWVLSKS